MMQITITTDTNPTSWGDECGEELAQAAAEKLAEMLATFARETWPEAEVEARAQRYADGEYTPVARVQNDAMNVCERNDVLARIEFEQERIWVDALQEALDEEPHNSPVYEARIAIGAARREGREPSHDAEYLSIYWRDNGEYLVEDNAGVVGSDAENYLQSCACQTEEEWAEVEAIQAEIDEIVGGPGALALPHGLCTGPLGGEARQLAKIMGWPINEDGAYDPALDEEGE